MTTWLTVAVARRTAEAEDICSFDLVPLAGQTLPAFAPGAHIDVQVAPGLVRQYSLCGNPAQAQRWRLAVLREPQSRGGSAGLHARLQPGHTLQVSPPRNLFALDAAAPDSLLLAGGIGITPLLAMAWALHGAQRRFALHYSARSSARMAFRQALQQAPFSHQVRLYAGDDAQHPRLDVESALESACPQTHLYVCGPTGFMSHVLDSARRRGWAEHRLHREHFAATPTPTSGDRAFTVRLARSGRVITIPADRSVLQVLQDQGVALPSSCETGVCGTCLTPVLAGEPDHRDSFLTNEERSRGDCFTPCCSRARSAELRLDL